MQGSLERLPCCSSAPSSQQWDGPTIYDASEGLAQVQCDGLDGFIDREGKLRIPHAFSFTSPFSEGLAAVTNHGNKGFINRSGDFEIPAHFTATGRFRGGLCLVTTEQEIGYINTAGEFVWRGPYVDTPLGYDLRF